MITTAVPRSDAALAVAVWLLSAALVRDPVAWAVAAGLAGPVAVRRAMPGLALVAGTVAALAHLVLFDEPLPAIVAVPFLVHALARWSGRRALARAGLGIALAGAVAAPLRWLAAEPGPLGAQAPAVPVVAYLAVVCAAYAWGTTARDAAGREQERALRRAAEERAVVAREVHDVVAHALAVIAVQAEGGRAVARADPARARQALDTIADTTREALTAMREVVDVLRADGPPDASAVGTPGPGPSGAYDLAALVGRAGDRIRLYVDPAVPTLDPALGGTVHRVVQEAVTNVLRHAGPRATADVRLTVAQGSLEVVIADDGRGPVPAPRPGQGLRNIAERVAHEGGSCWTGPGTGGGFVVRARLPLAGIPR